MSQKFKDFYKSNGILRYFSKILILYKLLKTSKIQYGTSLKITYSMFKFFKVTENSQVFSL